MGVHLDKYRNILHYDFYLSLFKDIRQSLLAECTKHFYKVCASMPLDYIGYSLEYHFKHGDICFSQ